MAGKSKINAGSMLDDHDLAPVLISGIEPPDKEDIESDGALGARHVEHNLEVLLLRFDNITLDTEIYLIWNNPEAPVDYLIIQPENLGNRFFSLMVDKAQILPDWAEVYCLIKRPSGNPSKTKPLKLRVKRNRPADPDPNPEADGNQGLVFFLPSDLEAGSHVDMARAERGVWLEIQPWENMAEWDICRIAWGTAIIEHVVKAHEVWRSFEMFITPEIIKENPHYPDMPVAMQIKDVGGNYPADPGSKSNWSEIQRVEVNLGLLRPRPPFLKQAGEVVDLDELGGGAQTVQVFIDNNFFEAGDKMAFEWEGRDFQNLPIFHSEQRDVELTNFIEEFYVPNEIVSAIAGGIAIMYYDLYKARDDVWLPSRKVRIRIDGDVIEWPAPSIVEAPNGELKPTSIATMKYRAQDGWTSATKLRIVWAAHSVNFTEEFFLGPIPEDKELSFTVPNEQVRRFNMLHVEVYYERIDLMPYRQSQRLSIRVDAPPIPLEKVTVDNTSGDYLDPNNIGTHAMVNVRLTDSWKDDLITLDWNGDVTSTSVQVRLREDQAGRTLVIPIERKFVTDNVGRFVRIKYSLARQSVPTRLSPIYVLHIFMGFDHITNFRNNNVNGWIYGPALSDLRDRAFRNYGSYSTFYNYTYPRSDKRGVVFVQVFRNLYQGRRYEFSMKVRRFDGRYTLPSLSLSTSQSSLTAATAISDMVGFQILSGVMTANSTVLTLYINSHNSSSDGNDYEISEIRFRLM